MSPADAVELFDKSISLLMSLKRLATSIVIPVKHYRESGVITLDRAIEDYYSGAKGLGSLVTVEGLISPYVMSSRPRFDSDTMMKMTGSKISPTFSPDEVEVRVGMMSFPAQYPIQTIPPVLIDGKLNYLYFLYPPDLTSFLLDERASDKTKDELVNRTQKPVLVISHDNLYSELNKIVKVTGALVRADSDIVSSLSKNFSEAHQKILSNSLKPFSDGRSSLCLDLRVGHKITGFDGRKILPATIYLESHFENILKVSNYQKFSGASIPGATDGFHWSANSENGLYWGLSTTDTSVCTSDYENYGFFTDVLLNDRVEFERQMALFHGFISVFRKNIQNRARNEHGVEVKHNIDFVFDFNRAKHFHPEGVMVSKKIEAMLRDNSHLQMDVEWIRRGHGKI